MPGMGEKGNPAKGFCAIFRYRLIIILTLAKKSSRTFAHNELPIKTKRNVCIEISIDTLSIVRCPLMANISSGSNEHYKKK